MTKEIENTLWKTTTTSSVNYLQLTKHPELFIPQTFTKAKQYNPHSTKRWRVYATLFMIMDACSAIREKWNCSSSTTLLKSCISQRTLADHAYSSSFTQSLSLPSSAHRFLLWPQVSSAGAAWVNLNDCIFRHIPHANSLSSSGEFKPVSFRFHLYESQIKEKKTRFQS